MKILNVYNNAPLYREAIFTLMDKTFNCDWVFGEAIDDIKQLDLSRLGGNSLVVKNIQLLNGRAYWQKSVIKQLRKDYTHYIFLGEERCLSTWTFLLLSKFYPSKKMYLWTHGPYGKEGFMKRFIQKLFYRLADGIFLYGDYAKRIMIERGFEENKLFTIHNSLNYNRQLELRNHGLISNIFKNHFGNDRPVIIFIGRLTKVKQLHRIIDAVYMLKGQGEYYNVVFVGDGSERNNLENRVGQLSLDEQIWFYGACYDEMMNAELIYNADLCVAPGNVGLTAMHTMVFGTPVITHNNFPWQMPEFEAIHIGKTGDFFEFENTDSLTRVISRWFSKNANNREVIRKACFEEIDTQWNPYFQLEVLKKVL